VTLSGRRIGLVGPLPPPAGGMANQTRQLAELLEREGAKVTLVRVVMATRHPSPAVPTRHASGTRTSSKNTSLNSAEPVA